MRCRKLRDLSYGFSKWTLLLSSLMADTALEQARCGALS